MNQLLHGTNMCTVLNQWKVQFIFPTIFCTVRQKSNTKNYMDKAIKYQKNLLSKLSKVGKIKKNKEK